MKTRDRILETSLMLFNDEGEQNVTTVDIANEMEISPGNLYYHFRGKDVIIEELFSEFEVEMKSILAAPADKPLNLEDNWFYLYVVLEEIHKFRFFYLNLTDILQRNSALRKRFQVLIELKKVACQKILEGLSDRGAFSATEQDISQLIDKSVMILTYWFPFQMLTQRPQSTSESIHRGVYQLMTLVGPYFGEGQQDFYVTCQALYDLALNTAD